MLRGLAGKVLKLGPLTENRGQGQPSLGSGHLLRGSRSELARVNGWDH